MYKYYLEEIISKVFLQSEERMAIPVPQLFLWPIRKVPRFHFS